jgi:rsbT co-antagonist protein RsbR
VSEQLAAATLRPDLISEADLRRESSDFLALICAAGEAGAGAGLEDGAWKPMMSFLTDMSRSRAVAGFSPSETATFVFSLKQPLFSLLQEELAGATTLVAEIGAANALLDLLGLYTMEAYQKTREAVITRQQAEMLELSTPVVSLWNGILALPLIGTLDSARTQVVMESLLETIVSTTSAIAIIDITGVPTVDTLVAQHLLKTVAAARLMGATCIISGIRPQIAQTMVHLGVGFEDVRTTASLADALTHAFRLRGLTVIPGRAV